MPTLISRANGNFTDAATWGLAGTVSLLDSQTGTTASTTTYQNSATFIPLAVEIDALLLKVSSKAGTIGTLDVSLYNNTTAAEAKLVSVNLADLPSNGWVAFKFSSSITPNGTDSYLIRVRHSSGASLITLFRDATAANWSRLLRTTVTAAPLAGDKIVIAGELTGLGTGNNLTVTFDNIATTIFGDNSTTIPSFTINKRGILTLGVAAATNYYLKLNSNLNVHDGGTLNLGTSGTPLPNTSTCVVEFNSSVAGDFGLEVINGGNLNVYGATKRSWCLLTANISAAATILTVADTTGWQVGDEICIGSTSRTNTECEKRTILTIDSPTQITLSSGVTYAHSGTSPTQAEIGNLTRNIKIRGISLTLTGYILCYATSQVIVKYLETTNLGINTFLKQGITLQITTGACDWQNSTIHEPVLGTGGSGFFVSTTSGSMIISLNVVYNLTYSALNVSATTGAHTIQNNLFMRDTAVDLVILADVGGIFTGNYIVGGATTGLLISEAASIGTMTGNVIHSCATIGLTFSAAGTFNNTSLSFVIWRCLNTGIALVVMLHEINFNNCILFGNALNVLAPVVNGFAGIITFSNCIFSGDTTFASTHGITNGTNGAIRARIIDSTFGVVSGIKTAHTTADIGTGAGVPYYRLFLWNTILASGIEVQTPSITLGFGESFIKSSNHDQIAGKLRSWYKNGIIESDTSIFSTLSPSLKLIPSNASGKLSYVIAMGAISSGTSLQISVKIRQSIAGDGAAYNGNLPRLLVRKNEQLGVLSDTVIATATAASLGAWETLTGIIPAALSNGIYEIFVDADGTAGWVNVDDIILPASPNTTGLLYGLDGEYRAIAGGFSNSGNSGMNSSNFNYLGQYPPFLTKVGI